VTHRISTSATLTTRAMLPCPHSAASHCAAIHLPAVANPKRARLQNGSTEEQMVAIAVRLRQMRAQPGSSVGLHRATPPPAPDTEETLSPSSP
jgi:hypothetical protein